MTYENFLKVILAQRKMEQQINKAYKLKIDLIDFVDDYNGIIKTLLTEVYGETGYEWYSWFCWENDYGEKDWSKSQRLIKNEDGKFVTLEDEEIVHGATDESGNAICYSFETLWQYLEEIHKPKSELL